MQGTLESKDAPRKKQESVPPLPPAVPPHPYMFCLSLPVLSTWPWSSKLSRSAPGCVTCHTRHASVTHFRPISGNIVEVTLMTSPKHVYNSHTKETYFP